MVLNLDVELDPKVSKVVVVGTGTEVGKTWVTAELIGRARALDVKVAARKVVQSFDPSEPVETQDRSILARASGEDPLIVCPDAKSFALALAPPMAAQALGRPAPDLEQLLDMWPCDPGSDQLFIETAGGLRSPQGSDADALDVAAWVDPDVVLLVAADELGVISLVRLCHDALSRRLGEAEIAVVLNDRGTGASVGGNAAWLRDHDGYRVFETHVGLDDLAEQLVGLATG